MEPDEAPVRATSFGAIADDYDRYRPGPPADGVDWALPASCESVVDIGAGTGALTRLLVDRAHRVVAVDPDARMGAVLGARVPSALVVAGRAEALPVRNGSVDAVMGASMWHWVDQPRAAAEAARVLRPGGVLGALWGGPDLAAGWLGELLGRRGRSAEGELAATVANDRADPSRHQLRLPDDAPFETPERHDVNWTVPMTPDELVGLAGTYSRFIILPEAERDQVREALREVVQTHPALEGRTTIDLPMHCTCWRAVRRS